MGLNLIFPEGKKGEPYLRCSAALLVVSGHIEIVPVN